MVTVTGGKLTTYRQMAEDTVDTAVRRLGSAVPAGAARSRTRRMQLLGAARVAELAAPGAASGSGLDEPVFTALVGRHGDETPAVLALADGRPELLEPLVPGLPHLKAEALWAARHEMACTLDDVLSRRTRALLRRARSAADVAGDVGALVGTEWSRTSEAVAEEAAAVADRARRDLERAGLAAQGQPR
jgi:glycerol-3-phosphate dehydrogenase